jgi:predicted DsbA family dithiol-disulfide isomerase
MAREQAQVTVTIDIVSDTVCPWCYVGKRTLDKVLAGRDDCEVTWHPFQLNADVPMEGVDRDAFWEAKFGSRERISGMVDTLTERGRQIGIEFRFDLIKMQPNTLRSHALLHLASENGTQHAVKEALLAAFFEQGEDIGQVEVLARIGESNELDRDRVIEHLSDQSLLEQISAAANAAREMGITGVPSFIVNRRHLLPGAVEADVLSEMLDRAAADESGVASD